MKRLRGQRGYTQMTKVVLLLLVAAAIYLSIAFWPVAKSYYRIRQDAVRLANLMLKSDIDHEAHIRRFLEETYARDGVMVARPDVDLDRRTKGLVDISIRLTLPYQYPFTGTNHFWNTTVEVSAERIRGY
ncbi:hypothetical protein ACFL6C_08075 [Myxococcota bacterium]